MLTRSFPRLENPANKRQLNQYFNNHNYFNKSTIKMSQMRQKMFLQMHKENKTTQNRNPLPKMLFSYSSSSRDNNTKDYNLSPAHYYTPNEPAEQKPLFNDLLDCVDDIDIHLSKGNVNDEEDLLINEEDMKSKRNHQDTKINVATEITDTTFAQEIKDAGRNHKEVLHFNNFGKYKFSEQGLNFPNTTDSHHLPNYTGKNPTRGDFFNYRKQINNPKLIYNSIGTFNEKFNKELGRISHSYGTERSKGHFVSNPLMNSYKQVIPIYDLYKDIKQIQSRITDKNSKFKLLPLINNKIKNFDRLGQKVYRNMKLSKEVKDCL